MSVSSSPLSPSAVVTRLRAAGCVFAEDEATLLRGAARDPHDLAALVERREAGEPLEQILGWAEFCGLRIAVDPGVFVPRRRTQFLVEHAVELVQPPAFLRPPAVVVDLCCGSGAVGAAILAGVALVELHAADIDPAAVACARRNLEGSGTPVYQGDLYEPLPARLRGRVQALVANAPYVPTDEVGLMPSEARAYEPLTALDGGADGLDVARRVVAEAPDWLAPGGHLMVETSRRQAALLADAFATAGLGPNVLTDDDLGATIVAGTRPAEAP